LDADETTELLTSLCRSGWLRGKRPRRWLVNQNLFKTPFAQTAETADTASQRSLRQCAVSN
jgi:hypothetical protein